MARIPTPSGLVRPCPAMSGFVQPCPALSGLVPPKSTLVGIGFPTKAFYAVCVVFSKSMDPVIGFLQFAVLVLSFMFLGVASRLVALASLFSSSSAATMWWLAGSCAVFGRKQKRIYIHKCNICYMAEHLVGMCMQYMVCDRILLSPRG